MFLPQVVPQQMVEWAGDLPLEVPLYLKVLVDNRTWHCIRSP